MEPTETVRDRGRLARLLAAVTLAVVAVTSLRKGKRARGVAAGAGAVALGYSTAARTAETARAGDVDRTREDAELHCAICDDPIRPGQRRQPRAGDGVVHEDCLAPSE